MILFCSAVTQNGFLLLIPVIGVADEVPSAATPLLIVTCAVAKSCFHLLGEGDAHREASVNLPLDLVRCSPKGRPRIKDLHEGCLFGK